MKPRLVRLGVASLVPALAAGALTAFGGRPADNGIGGLTAKQILARSLATLKGETNLVLKGSIKIASAKIGLDIESSGHGNDSAGTLSSSASSAGFVGTIRFVDAGGAVYLNAGPALWREFGSSGTGLTAKQYAALVSTLSNRWIKLGASDAKSFAQSFGQLTNTTKLATGLVSGGTKASKGKATTIDGVHVLALNDGSGGTLYIALAGPPRPIELSGSSAGSSGTITFGYPSRLTITAPASSLTLQQVAQRLGG
ncbi:MAG TPA: hypothetical protein VMU75_02300 [Acidimicrobiales bacterium]|nr:hypothetical protein [Acidimicrobiales bacterium]